MGTFFFKAVASDGKLRSGSITGENEKVIARELRKQGLTPVYVGVAPKKSGFELKLPSFSRGRRRDVLFFTQELSTLLNAGVPLDRALSITGELTERPEFRFIILDILRILKGGRSFADSLAAHPEYFSDLFVNMVRAGEASGALGVVFERLSEFERSRDELHGYIVSSMIYPGLLMMVGFATGYFVNYERIADDDPLHHAFSHNLLAFPVEELILDRRTSAVERHYNHGILPRINRDLFIISIKSKYSD